MVNDSEGLIVTGKPFTTPLLLDLGGRYAEFLTLEMGFQVLTLLGNQKPHLHNLFNKLSPEKAVVPQ